jgi:hypothetical protein
MLGFSLSFCRSLKHSTPELGFTCSLNFIFIPRDNKLSLISEYLIENEDSLSAFKCYKAGSSHKAF